ncbi:MAG: 50S ribosomal protein L25/general stress protein Ctc [Prevotellaceae bacterium]|jgi:large subunit ribosomal protein L25|nr:50S ribosomal protein L25/general stress protein Ctc [Prevotellaceae bacterium]
MKTIQLAGEKRADLGKKATKALRVEERVPCVLYGGKENVHFSATERDLRKLIYTPEVYIVDLTINNITTKAIIQDMQFHPVTDKALHIDFLELEENKPVAIEIPVKLNGLAEGVKAGGKLSLEMRKLRVKGLYSQFPECIEINIEKLGLGKAIQVGQVQVGDLELLNAKNAVVAQVKLTRAARGAAAAAAKES